MASKFAVYKSAPAVVCYEGTDSGSEVGFPIVARNVFVQKVAVDWILLLGLTHLAAVHVFADLEGLIE